MRPSFSPQDALRHSERLTLGHRGGDNELSHKKVEHKERTSPTIMMLLSFLVCFVGVSGLIGFFAAKKSRKSEKDYFLGGQTTSPYLLALSSSASYYSGFMFAGFMGMAFDQGTAVIWFGAGSTVGYILVYRHVVRRVQYMNSEGWALSIGELITFWHGRNLMWLRRLIGVIIIFFLSFYAAAQLKTGGTALHVAFGWPIYTGILMSTAMILFYCWAGGIRASIWTDAAQVLAMTLSLLLIFFTVVWNEGGFVNLFHSFMATAPLDSPDEVALIPQNLSVIGGYPGWMLSVLGALGVGLCAIGQPHVLVRAMALGSKKDAKKFIACNYTCEIIFYVIFLLVGLSTRVILKDASSFDPELALFKSAFEILPPIFVGFILAGTFSATLSTADSQILSCSASLLRDIPEPPKESLILAKTGTVFFCFLSAAIALFAKENIFSLVIFAFSGLGASIGSILVLRFFNVKIPEWVGILIVLTGGATVVIWNVQGLSAYLNEGVPGLICAFAVFFIYKGCEKIFSTPSG